MNDIDFLRKMEMAKKESSTEKQVSPTLPHCNQVIKKVLFTRTELTIYPSGETFQKSSSWFEKGMQVVKKKVKAKPQPAKKVNIKTIEEY